MKNEETDSCSDCTDDLRRLFRRRCRKRACRTGYAGGRPVLYLPRGDGGNEGPGPDGRRDEPVQQCLCHLLVLRGSERRRVCRPERERPGSAPGEAGAAVLCVLGGRGQGFRLRVRDAEHVYGNGIFRGQRGGNRTGGRLEILPVHERGSGIRRNGGG